MDGPDNPYRQLSITALSSPILLETIVCIATESMVNYGLSSVPVAAERQQQMLRSLGQSLLRIDTANLSNASRNGRTINTNDHEEVLTAVVLQGIVTAQTVDGAVEPHIKCASFLMQALDCFKQAPQTPLARMTIQRYAMVDLMLAISRQRRPFSPPDFILYHPDEERWDLTEPSFHKMTGCPQPLMCFLVQIAHLACDVDERLASGLPITDILDHAFRLDTDLRAWGSQYTKLSPNDPTRQPLDILTECFYWTAHLLLSRRVFRDRTCSLRVQHLTHTCFRLMDHLVPGCGPDSSLPQPFYLAAREAITPEDRNWVRKKHDEMTAVYREQQRNGVMGLTERIWEGTDALRMMQNSDTALSVEDSLIKALDRESCLFIF